MIYKKNFNQLFVMFLFFLVSFCFLSFKEAKKTLAYATIVDYCVDGEIGVCSKGGGGECPYCGSSKNYCCADGSAWTKYDTVCDVTITSSGYYTVKVYTVYLTPSTTLCSTADKWNSADPRLVRAGLCSCATGGIYKACCDSSTGNLVNSIRYWVGNAYDADCPAGTTIWAGGANIDLAWADANCNPPCTPDCAASPGYTTTCYNQTFIGNCGQTCTGGIASSCSNPAAFCVGTTYNDNCGAAVCTGTLAPNCSLTSDNYCVGTTFTAANGCGTCTGTKPAVAKTNGVCGTDDGKILAAPPTNLCSVGTASAITTGTTTYTWSCKGTDGVCPTSTGGIDWCTATRDLDPTLVSFDLYNNAETTKVPMDSGTRYQTCHTWLGADNRNLKWKITGTDAQTNDIQYMTIRFLNSGGTEISRKQETTVTMTDTHTGYSMIAINVDDANLVNGQTYTVQVAINDIHNPPGNDGWHTIATLKVWNCNVPVTGKLYDGGASGSCSVAADYLTPAIATNFTSLQFTDSPTMIMNRVSENEYNGNLTWGKSYTSIFNTDLAMQILGSGVRIISLPVGTTSCPGSMAFSAGSALVDPYANSPSLRIDFSGVVDQDSWYQTVGGGLMANSQIINRVPVTCVDPITCAMSVNVGTADNGIVASQTINNTGNSGVNKGYPNNWWVNKPLVSNLNSDYTYFLNQYFWKGGIGTTITGNKYFSDLGANPTGVYYINGDLSVTTDNNVNPGSFLMVIVSGDITIQPNVINLEGIFVSRNFNVGGDNDTPLNFEGMIKATNSVKSYRTFTTKRTNNTTPAVKFVYRPDFVFNMPGAIAKQLVKWQWGN